MDTERGFTLIETIVVVAIVSFVVFGVWSLAQPSVAVAAAHDGLGAAFDEARAAALTSDAATVVIATTPDGKSFSAQVFAHEPGSAGFAPRNGPTYEGRDVSVSETAAPLGPPGMAFALSHFGEVVGYAHYAVGDASFATETCPSGGAFMLRLQRSAQTIQYAIPCRRAVSAAVAPVVYETSAPTITPAPPSAGGCPPSSLCSLPPLQAPTPPACPNGYQPDPIVPGQCDVVHALQTLTVCALAGDPDDNPNAGQTITDWSVSPPVDTTYVASTAIPPCTAPTPAPPAAPQPTTDPAPSFFYSVAVGAPSESCSVDPVLKKQVCTYQSFGSVNVGASNVNGSFDFSCKIGNLILDGSANDPPPDPSTMGLPASSSTTFPDTIVPWNGTPGFYAGGHMDGALFVGYNWVFSWATAQPDFPEPADCSGISSRLGPSSGSPYDAYVADPNLLGQIDQFMSTTPLFDNASVPSADGAN